MNPENLIFLLPSQISLCLQSWELDRSERKITLCVASIQSVVQCPVCQQSAHRVHSRYQRTLADLPWADYKISLQLQVRKFFCEQAECKRRIFTERIPSVVEPWARRTQRMAQQLTALALSLGGAAGARLSRKLHCEVSRNTLLRLVLRLPLPTVVTPKTLGVDDFAFRKRQTYGTIVVDLEQHRPVALLTGRDGGTLSTWLKQHPGVEVLSRDRSTAYKSGMTQGAPTATQVADRFHLLQNLADALEQVLRTQGTALKAAQQAHLAAGTSNAESEKKGSESLVEPLAASHEAVGETESAYARRRALHQEIWELYKQGWSTAAIAHQVSISIRTVQHYLNKPQFPEQQRRSDYGKSLLEPYKHYILQEYQREQRRPKGLLSALRQRGYQGSEETLARYLNRLRSTGAIAPKPRSLREQFPNQVVGEPPLTASQATWLILRHPERQTANDASLLTQLQQHPALASVIKLAQGFIQLVRQRRPQELDTWLEQANSSLLKPFQQFAQTLKEDYAAVKAGVTLAVSNGQVEGQINRLKMLKRQMYGRAGMELLRRRFLLAS